MFIISGSCLHPHLKEISTSTVFWLLLIIILWGFPSGSGSKESACSAGALGSISGSGGSPGEGNGYPFQYSYLENSMDRGAWGATVHGVVKSRTWLSDFTFPFHFRALEKEVATHSSILAWRIPWTEEHGGLQSMGLQRVRLDFGVLMKSSWYKF